MQSKTTEPRPSAARTRAHTHRLYVSPQHASTIYRNVTVTTAVIGATPIKPQLHSVMNTTAVYGASSKITRCVQPQSLFQAEPLPRAAVHVTAPDETRGKLAAEVLRSLAHEDASCLCKALSHGPRVVLTVCSRCL